MTALRVVLASQSPRRRELLTLIGLAHEVQPADIDETARPNESPPSYAVRLAREKARVVGARAGDAIVVAADTIVVLDGDILGKPADRGEARRMLERLSGRTHTVHTAIAVRGRTQSASALDSVAVTFRTLSTTDIARYVDTGEPMDKAGAYGIQGFGATLVERISGDYFAVMGLGLCTLVRLLGELGVEYAFGALRPTARGAG